LGAQPGNWPAPGSAAQVREERWNRWRREINGRSGRTGFRPGWVPAGWGAVYIAGYDNNVYAFAT